MKLLPPRSLTQGRDFHVLVFLDSTCDDIYSVFLGMEQQLRQCGHTVCAYMGMSSDPLCASNVLIHGYVHLNTRMNIGNFRQMLIGNLNQKIHIQHASPESSILQVMTYNVPYLDSKFQRSLCEPVWIE